LLIVLSKLKKLVDFDLEISEQLDKTKEFSTVLIFIFKYMENWEFNNENTGLFLETPGIYSFFRVK
jgi:hypothetical protein